MLKKLSFVDAHERLKEYERAVYWLSERLSQSEMDMLHDALNQYAQTPAFQGCDEDGDMAALFALAFSEAGFNSLLPEYDCTRCFVEAPKDA